MVDQTLTLNPPKISLSSFPDISKSSTVVRSMETHAHTVLENFDPSERDFRKASQASRKHRFHKGLKEKKESGRDFKRASQISRKLRFKTHRA